MTDNGDTPIRDRAYAIWQAEGEPQGRDREHWEQAKRELAQQDDAAAADDASAQDPGTIPAP